MLNFRNRGLSKKRSFTNCIHKMQKMQRASVAWAHAVDCAFNKSGSRVVSIEIKIWWSGCQFICNPGPDCGFNKANLNGCQYQ